MFLCDVKSAIRAMGGLLQPWFEASLMEYVRTGKTVDYLSL